MSIHPHSKTIDHYAVLNLPSDATDDEVRAAYKKLALKWHPDRHTVEKEHAAQMFIEVNAAYKALMNGNESSHSKSTDDLSKSSSASDRHSTHSSSKSTAQSSTGQENNASESPSPEPAHSPACPASEFGTKSAPSSASKSRKSSHSHSSSSHSSRARDTRSKSRHSDPHESRTTHPTRESDHSSRNEDDRSRRSSCRHATTSESKHRHSPPDSYPDTHADTHTHSPYFSAAPPTESGKSVHSRSSRTHEAHAKASNFVKPVIPPASLRHKSSRFGLGDEFVQRLSKGVPKRQKSDDMYDSDDEGAPVYSSPLRPLMAPRGSSKEWIFPLPLTLDDMYHGTNFRFRIIREMRSRQKKVVEIEIDIPPGCRSGTRVTCPGTGHERKDGTLQDVVFLVEEVRHDRFTRVKDDLFLDVCVPWVDSLADQGGELCIEGLDGQEITFSLPYPFHDKATEGKVMVKGAGMPISSSGKVKGRGDLIIRWQVVFSNPSKWQTFRKVLRMKT